jgi:hypothetical protein
MNDADIKQLVALTSKAFNTFGRGSTSEFNPLTHYLADKPPMFAMGVDVEQVVRFVLRAAECDKDRQRDDDDLRRKGYTDVS